MKKVFALSMLGIFLVSFAIAMENIDADEDIRSNIEELRTAQKELGAARIELREQLVDPNLTAEEREDIRAQMRELSKESIDLRYEVKKEIRSLRDSLKEGEEREIRGLKIRRAKGNIFEFRLREKEAIQTELEIEDDEAQGELRTRLSDGRNATIKILPEVASKRALERLRLKNCNEDKNCTIELKEVDGKAIYEARARKTYKVLGMFKNKEDVRTQIDAETGEEIVVPKRPWWAWMASEAEEADELEE